MYDKIPKIIFMEVGKMANYNLQELKRLASVCQEAPKFSEETYREKQVKRGLRDIDGTGVIAGLTNISDVIAKKVINGEKVNVHVVIGKNSASIGSPLLFGSF